MSSLSDSEILIEAARSTAEAIAEAAHAAAELIAKAARTTSPNLSSYSPKLPNLTEMCSSHTFFKHSSQLFFQKCLPASALDYFWLLDIQNPFTLFENPNLNLGATYIRHFVETKVTHDWLHIMIKAMSFKSFMKAMNEDGGKTRTLAFSCWCDGGPYREAWYRQHRHLIVVAPKNHFQMNVWPKIKGWRVIPFKGMKEIKNPRHLMNALGYLSKRTSRCQFVLDYSSQNHSLESNHFYIFKTLPIDFRKCLATQWNNGILQLFYQEHTFRASVHRLVEKPLIFENCLWKQLIGHFYNLERKIVLPVKKGFSPSKEKTQHYLFKTDGEKLFFRFDANNEHLSQDIWLEKQVEGGNSFYDAIAEKFWVPRFEKQKQISDLMIRAEQIADLEKKRKELTNTTLNL